MATHPPAASRPSDPPSPSLPVRRRPDPDVAAEFAVAERLFANVVHSGCLDGPSFNYLHSAMSVFNGDLLLAAHTPAGALRVMVGDFTGHGLAAAVGAMPAAEVFYGMTAKGFAIGDMVVEIARKLRRILPTGRMFAAAVLELNPGHHELSVWNGGVPDVLVVDGAGGGIKARVASFNLPLSAVSPQQIEKRLEVVEIEPGDRVYAYSDGVLEAANPRGEMFGQAALEALLDRREPPRTLFADVAGALDRFRAGENQTDDITLVEVLCDAGAAAPALDERESGTGRASTDWRVSLELGPDTLGNVDPLPLLTHLVNEYQGLNRHWDRVYTLLAELYRNALDHGLLGLDSAMKDSAEGFARFYAVRAERLAALAEGHIRIDLHNVPDGDGGLLVLRVEDSGPGFDVAGVLATRVRDEALGGRGLALVRKLADRFEFNARGNAVEVEYRWT